MSQYAKDIIDISDRLFRYAEPAATLVTGAAAEPLSGLYGLANLAITRNPDAAANAVNQAQRALTYQPRTAQGQAGLRGLQDILQPIGEVVQGASQSLGDKAYGATGSPALAAAAYSAPTAMLEALGLKGLSIAKSPVKAADLYTPRMSAGSFGKIQNFRAPDFELDPSELADVGAEVTDGMVTLYHRTTPEAAEKIRKSGKFETKEDGVFFSTSLDGQAKDYGEGIVKVKVPSSMLQLDDIFDNEAHVRVPMNKAGAIDLKRFIANDEQPARPTNAMQ